MKRLILALVLICSLCGAYGQTIHRNGNNFVAESTKTSKAAMTETKFTYTDTDGKTYTIWINPKNGRAFIIRQSKTTGNEYRKYLGEDVSREICQELGISYTYVKPSKSK